MELKPGYKQTDIGAVPESWTIETLGALGKWLSGGTPSMSDKTYWGGSIPWVSAKDMKVSRLRDASDHVSEKALTCGARLAPQNAILMVVRGMILAHSLPVARAERTIAFNQDLKALVARDSIESDYLLWWFQAHKSVLLSVTTESTHGTKRLPSDTLFAQEIALPPFPEQEAIAQALSDADALIESLEQLIAKKRHLKRGAMQELLTGKVRLSGFASPKVDHRKTEAGMIPADWETKSLHEVASIKTGPFGTLLKAAEYAESDGVPLISVGEIREGFLQITDQTPRCRKLSSADFLNMSSRRVTLYSPERAVSSAQR